jgi:hypothetical protein
MLYLHPYNCFNDSFISASTVNPWVDRGYFSLKLFRLLT